jgi:hypothetical protein
MRTLFHRHARRKNIAHLVAAPGKEEQIQSPDLPNMRDTVNTRYEPNHDLTGYLGVACTVAGAASNYFVSQHIPGYSAHSTLYEVTAITTGAFIGAGLSRLLYRGELHTPDPPNKIAGDLPVSSSAVFTGFLRGVVPAGILVVAGAYCLEQYFPSLESPLLVKLGLGTGVGLARSIFTTAKFANTPTDHTPQ